MTYRDNPSARISALEARNGELEDALKRSMAAADRLEAHVARLTRNDDSVPWVALLLGFVFVAAVFELGAHLGAVLEHDYSRIRYTAITCKETRR